jgi:hypothetical protein
MDNINIETLRLTAARCTLTMIASGLKPRHTRVKDIAEMVGAPKQFWKATMLLRWVDEKILVTS